MRSTSANNRCGKSSRGGGCRRLKDGCVCMCNGAGAVHSLAFGLLVIALDA